ncbi:MAG: carbamoyl-phosphate synthase, small subunit [Anaerocolumna sp.]|jgi:carbamoyl-phosphate synthase small subunit|nr:carbamoyl-phosphate synthase, small subunit [Anaerocolumna sp.]
MKAYLILEDGNVFTGRSIGSTRDMISEIVFNTSMTGYLEVLTDPSYAGQAVVMTYPLIGNYGICYEDMESRKPWVDGYIVREIARRPSNFRSESDIETFLKEKDIPGIEGIDTRALTKILREKGTMNGMITTNENFNLDDVIKQLKQHKVTGVVEKVTCKEKTTYLSKDYVATDADNARSGLKLHPYKKGNFKVALLDYGSKDNIKDCLLKRDCDVTIYPALTKADEILADAPDGIMLSNGPGDPKECVTIIEEIKKLYSSNVPIFAICLGHQLMALANGGDTKKLKYGHRGANHPVKDLKTGRVYISSQNHGYVVESGSLSDDIAEVSFINANDKTIEGYHYLGKNIFTVQFHPEACAGPQDSEFLFDEFIQMMEVSK